MLNSSREILLIICPAERDRQETSDFTLILVDDSSGRAESEVFQLNEQENYYLQRSLSHLSWE